MYTYSPEHVLLNETVLQTLGENNGTKLKRGNNNKM